MEKKVEIEIPKLPKGCELVSYRKPKQGDWYLDNGKWTQSHIDFQKQFVIVAERSKQYREPVLPEDYGKQCEFSDDGETWEVSALEGFVKFVKDAVAPWCASSSFHKFCRIEVTE